MEFKWDADVEFNQNSNRFENVNPIQI
jgi:hypothetical protein